MVLGFLRPVVAGSELQSPEIRLLTPVIPAKAGIQKNFHWGQAWIPGLRFATPGMTSIYDSTDGRWRITGPLP